MRSPAETSLPYAEGFAAHLLDPATPGPSGIAGPHGKGAEKRFGVYRNNVTVGLVNALASMFPATERIVGEEFFRAMAKLYVRSAPPRSRLLAEYGADLADFVDAFPPLGQLPWLPDVVRVERAWLDAYHAADAGPLMDGSLGAISPHLLGEVVFEPHPAARIIRSRFPVVTIFSANREKEDVAPLDLDRAQDALVTRPQLDVLVTSLPPGGATFLEALIAGETLAAAAGRAATDEPAFDLGANIRGMIDAAVFTAVGLPAHREQERDFL